MILMTSNQWKCDKNQPAWEEKGEDCSAQARSAGLIKAYTQITPDVIAIQEASELMSRLVMEKMESYEHNGEKVHYALISGGDTPIIYRDDRFSLVDSGFFRYDESIPGFEGSFNNGGTKSYTYGVFKDKSSGKLTAVMSTHLWWKSSNPQSADYQPMSDEARAYQIEIAINKMEELTSQYGCEGFIMGDLNSTEISKCLIRAGELGWQDAFKAAFGAKDKSSGHHPCFAWGHQRGKRGTYYDAIDHILVKKDTTAEIGDYLRITDPWFDVISDHYPLYVTCK